MKHEGFRPSTWLVPPFEDAIVANECWAFGIPDPRKQNNPHVVTGILGTGGLTQVIIPKTFGCGFPWVVIVQIDPRGKRTGWCGLLVGKRRCPGGKNHPTLHPWRLTWNMIMEVWFRSFSLLNGWFVDSMSIFQGGFKDLFHLGRWSNLTTLIFF